MNILFFLTPKAMCSYVDADSTLRQAMERMENSGYTALPILDDQRPQTGQHAFARCHPACQTAAKDQTIRSTHAYTSQMPPLAMEPTFLENSRRKRW